MNVTPAHLWKPRYLAMYVLCIAIGVNYAIGLKLGMRQPMISDSRQFLVLAQSLAAGEGYRCRETFWPDTPSMQRLPGWPVAIAAGLRLLPAVSPDTVMRAMGLALNAIAAALLFVITYQLFKRPGVAFCAGLAYVFNPTGIYLAYNGLSEALFLVLVLSGVLLLLAGGVRRIAGFALMGCACLERANFILWIGFFCIITAVSFVFSRNHGWRLPGMSSISSLLLGVIFFMIPPVVWIGRNYLVSHHFPVLSTLRGAALYGSNNPVVADDLKYWGYWVFPDQIPGETSQVDLAKTKTEYEVDVYYYAKGVGYLKHQWFAMPRLLVGKLVRAYVPVPWKPSWGAYFASIYRIMIYMGAILGVVTGWRILKADFRNVFIAMALTNIATVLIFYGYARFTFSVEPLLLPIAALLLVRKLPERSSAIV